MHPLGSARARPDQADGRVVAEEVEVAEQRNGPANAAGEELVLQIMAVFGGAGAVAALPLLAAVAQGQAPVQLISLTFAFPLALVAVGRLQQRRHWQVAAGIVAALLAVLLAVQSGPTAFAVVVLLAVGAPLSLILVGKYLLDQDRIAAGAWLLSTSIALIAGFLAVANQLAGTIGAVAFVIVIGGFIALQRLRYVARNGAARG